MRETGSGAQYSTLRPSLSTTSFPQSTRRHNQPAIDTPRSVPDESHDGNPLLRNFPSIRRKANPEVLTFRN
ncbi:hypothetical protein FJTKL_03443 [Diaporthe vaccinii]|uniref:Uncharacterized protein n=1 Tax=Diaporthe vaccinii TaxID=105482 RepID=A0ABR4F294_9PEZI